MFSFLIALLIAGGPSPALAQDANTALKMREIVKRVVAETGEQVIGLGSWISQANYRDPLKIAAGSDHDLRLLMPRGTSATVAQQRWLAVRQALQRQIEKEFGAQAPKVLSSTNLYAPTQLMRGVEDQADALKRFVQLKQVPNLGYKGAVNSSTPLKLAEGLYGEGAAVYTQGYERAAGRLFYTRNGKVYEGFTSLTHLGEGEARYTIAGAAHTAGEWVHHADDALASGDGGSLSKYLARIERDLTKARDLARLPTGSSTSNELKALAARLKGGGSLAEIRPTVQAILRRARLESALVGRFGRAGSLQKAVLRVAVDGLEASTSLGKALSAAAEKVPADAIVTGLMLAATTYSTAKYAGEEEYLSVLTSLAPVTLGLPATVLAMAAQAAIEAARDGGYDLMAGRQDAFDLLDGVFSASGGVSPSRYTLDQLVSQMHTEEQLRAFVIARAQQAADRGFGEAAGRHDLGTAEAIVTRCYPVILAAWRDKRDALQFEFVDLVAELEGGALLLSYTPNPLPAPKSGAEAVATVTVDTADAKDGDRLARMRQILETLYGTRQGTFANVLTSWTPKGTEANYDNQRRFSFAGGGKQLVDVEQSISFGAAGLPKGSPTSGTILRKAMIEIDLGSDTKRVPAAPVGGRIAGQYPEPAHQGFSIAYDVSGFEQTKSEDKATATAPFHRRVSVRVPLGPVAARGTLKFDGTKEQFLPEALLRAKLTFTFYTNASWTDEAWARRTAQLQASGVLPAGYLVGPGGQISREWVTSNSATKPGQALAFDFAADLSWVAQLPKDMAGEFAVGLTLEGGSPMYPPLVVVSFSGGGKS